MSELLAYSFRGQPTVCPDAVAGTMSHFVREEYSVIVKADAEGNNIVYIHHWPSWLRRGTSKVIKAFLEFFYSSSPPATHGTCSRCGQDYEYHW